MRAAGFELSERDGRLVVRAVSRRLTDAERDELRALRDQVLADLRSAAKRGPKSVEAEPPPPSPMQRLAAAQREKVERLLTGPACRCGRCIAEDAAERLRDDWPYH